MTRTRSMRTLAAALAAATAAAAALTLPSSAAAAAGPDVDLLIEKALDIPVVSADGLARGLVAFQDGAVTDSLLASLTDLGVVRGLELQAIDAVAVTALPSVIAEVVKLPGVTAVEPQRRITLDLFASRTMIDAEGIGQAESYTRTVRDTDVVVDHDGLTGAGVTVAVLDSGIFAAHPDFGDRAFMGLHYSFSEIQDSGGISYEQWDTYAENTGTIALQDEIGHGTHVASTVGGDGSLSAMQGGPDLQGVAPGVRFISMKVATAPFGIVEDLDWEEAALAAFDYSIRHGEELGIKITQNSWGLLPAEPSCSVVGGPIDNCGEPTDFDGMARMVEAVNAAGISVIFSSGNDGPDFDTIDIFNDAGNAVAVGAACKTAADGGARCDSDEQIVTGFSSRGKEDGTGPQVDVIAPGDTIMAAASPSILVPLTECETATLEVPGYYCISGTSMASPHISGVAALMYEANMDLTPAQVESCLQDTADDVLEPGFDVASGFGMANARSAIACSVSLRAAAPSTPAPSPAVSASSTPSAAPAPAASATPAPAPAATPSTTAAAPASSGNLPATGGGAALLGLFAMSAAAAARRRR